MDTSLQNLQFECNLAQQLCELVNSPRALTVSLLLRNGEFGQYMGLSLDPQSYSNTSAFADDYLVTEILRKSPNLPLGIDRVASCITSFEDSEKRCSETNDLFYNMAVLPGWVERLKKNVARILGPLDKHALDQIFRGVTHGSGASVGVSGYGMVVSDKYDAIPTCTQDLLPFAQVLLGEQWCLYRPEVRLVQGNEFFTVPKNAKTDRGCATEPLLNMYLQQGIGRYFKRRLKQFGVDISDQSINQSWASVAQELGLATIDLSMASDLISCGLMFRILPERWLHLLDLARSKYMKRLDGTWTELEKFSTMGNGFTFGLETIVFYAVLMTVVPPSEHCVISAYGDDLICPQRWAREVLNALEYLGFKVNGEKSCLAGNFFESCGTDWFNGQSVRPFYLRRDEDDLVPYHVSAANSLRLYAKMRLCDVACDVRFRHIWKGLLVTAPRVWRNCRVPPQLGNSGFISTAEEAGAVWASTDGMEPVTRCRRIRLIPEYAEKRTFGVLLAALAGASDSETWLRLDSEASYRVGATDSTRLPGEVAIAIANFLRDSDSSESRGKEPMRGLYGLSRPGWATIDRWPDGFEWI